MSAYKIAIIACEMCDEEFSLGHQYIPATRKEAQKRGWQCYPSHNRDFCPEHVAVSS